MTSTNELIDHETSLVRAFVLREKQERCLYLLSDVKRRKKFLDRLGHFRWLDPRFTSEAKWNPNPGHTLWSKHEQGIHNLFQLLKTKGAGAKCWAISQNSLIDGREVDAKEALGNAVDSGLGTILSFVPGRLAYFKDEDESLLLVR